jgi:hypothetical protein
MYRLAEENEIQIVKDAPPLFHLGESGDLCILHRFILVGVCVCVLNAICSYSNFEAEMRRLNRGTSLVPWDELDGN